MIPTIVIAAAPAATGPTQEELDKSASSPDTWLMTNKSYDGHRYVTVDQINRNNVGSLKEVCTLDTKIDASAQSSPLLYRERMYFTSAQTTVAMDAKTCKEIWR